MPYRVAGRALCSMCNDFTAGQQCPRCGRDLCQRHAPHAESRCPDCEAEYAQVAALVRSVPIVLLTLRVGVVICVCLLLVLVGQLEAFHEIGSYLSFAGVAMTLTFIVALGVLWRGRRQLRQRFLAEQHDAPLVPVRAPDPRMLPMVRW